MERPLAGSFSLPSNLDLLDQLAITFCPRMLYDKNSRIINIQEDGFPSEFKTWIPRQRQRHGHTKFTRNNGIICFQDIYSINLNSVHGSKRPRNQKFRLSILSLGQNDPLAEISVVRKVFPTCRGRGLSPSVLLVSLSTDRDPIYTLTSHCFFGHPDFH